MKKFAVALALSLLASLATPIAADAACVTIGTGTVKVGGVISGGQVVICATTVVKKPAVVIKAPVVVKKPVVVPPKPVVKPIVKPVPVPVAKPVTTPCIIKISVAAVPSGLYVAGCQIVVVPPTPPVTIVKPPSVTPGTNTSLGDQAAFTPNSVSINAANKTGSPGFSFVFGAGATTHSKSGTVLGKAATVNFQPIGYQWSADGNTGGGSSFAMSWSSEGAHSVSLTVTYAASYLIAGSTSWVSVGNISSSASTSVTVTANPAPPPVVVVAKAPPLLVSGKCTVSSTYRC